MTDVTIELNGYFAKTDGRNWISSDKHTQDLLNSISTPDLVRDVRVYIPDMAIGMLELVVKEKPKTKVLKIENQKIDTSLPEGTVF